MAVRERLFARWYPIVAGWSERAGQGAMRARLLGSARGRTLELGAGSGYNLPYYTAAVTELVISEPSPFMREHLRQRLTDDPPPVGACELVDAGAEHLPFDDAEFDTVVSAYVHCTVPDPRAALREIARVLKPGGRYLFLEHVRSPDSRALALVQDVLERPHAWIAAGCHPNRRLEELLTASPLEVTELVRARMPRASPTVRPIIVGTAVAPA